MTTETPPTADSSGWLEPLSDEQVLQAVMHTIRGARLKHPKWPSEDAIHAAAIVSEEAGELTQAALQAHYEAVHHGDTALTSPSAAARTT